MLVIVVGGVFLSEFSVAALMAVIGVGSLWEFLRIARHSNVQPQKWYPIVVGTLVIASAFAVAAGYLPVKALAVIFPLMAVVPVIELYRKRETPLANVAVSRGGLLYAIVPMALMCFIAFRGGEYNPYVILAYIFTVWVNDIFAYLTGVAIGRHKLFERISPKKSWEGFFGGLLFAIGFAVFAGWYLGGNLIVWGGLGAVVVVSGVFGDLVESMYKRAAGIKDSGSIMPGHGGFKDRFDALLLSAPFVFCYFIIFAP